MIPDPVGVPGIFGAIAGAVLVVMLIVFVVRLVLG